MRRVTRLASMSALILCVGCLSAEERAQRVAEREARDQAKYNEIAQFLQTNYIRPNRNFTVEYDGRRGETVVFEFVRRIGGQLVERGSAEFTLEVDYDRERISRDRYRQIFEVFLIENDAPGRSRWIIMASRYEQSCFNCREMRLDYLERALLGLQYY